MSEATNEATATDAPKKERRAKYVGIPPGSKRTAAQKLADLAFIERLVLRAKPTREIAELISQAREYTLSHVQVHRDIKKLEEMWLASAMKDVSIEKQKMLRKLDVLENELWEAWDRSKLDEAHRTLTRTTPEGGAVAGDEESTQGEKAAKKVEAVKKVSRDGDASYTRQILEVMERRAKLLGLDAPAKSELSGPGGTPIAVQNIALSEAEQQAVIERHLQRSQTNGGAVPTAKADPA